jgi:hypothetical protein
LPASDNDLNTNTKKRKLNFKQQKQNKKPSSIKQNKSITSSDPNNIHGHATAKKGENE